MTELTIDQKRAALARNSLAATASVRATMEMVTLERAKRAAWPKPQPGPQTMFHNCKADIGIYGGAAGAGKTHAMLMEPLKHITVQGYAAVIFRREVPQITNAGGMWDCSKTMYLPLGSRAVNSPQHQHLFGEKSKIIFAGMQLEDDCAKWDGAQIPFIGFDQLEHFTRKQFFYMLSRNRSTCGVKPCIRATCNPSADSWLAGFIAWWIDQSTGIPIPERAGVLRWMVREGDDILWADTKEELLQGYAEDSEDPLAPKPLSVTFIPGNIYDNRELLKVNPQYLASLKGLNRVERERLLVGNWKIKAAAGMLFQRAWCEVVEVVPHDVDWVRYWDRAATEKTPENDPDWTVGVRLGRSRSTGLFYLGAPIRMQASAGKVESAIANTASLDGVRVRVGFPQDPGQAGKGQAKATTANLAAFTASAWIETGDKVVRFSPFSAQAEHGNVRITRELIDSAHGDAYLTGLENFPDGVHKDDADATSGAYHMFFDTRAQGMRDWARQEAERAALATEQGSAQRAKEVIQEPTVAETMLALAPAAPERGGHSFMAAFAQGEE